MRLLRSIINRRSSASKRENPSVSDYPDKRTLQNVLLGRKPNAPPPTTTTVTGLEKLTNNANRSGRTKPRSSFSSSSSCQSSSCDSSVGSMDSADASSISENGQPVEWQLPLVDVKNSEPQTMEQELQRLQVLQSYFVLDSQGEEDFDRITRLGAKLFDTPICLISLVDLGRQWFLSRVGLDATETPRKLAFCAHVIINKFKILIVPDATKDERFCNNPLVTGPPDIRFYAGAALVSPEGYKLGTLCVISPKTRPQGLSTSEQETLHEMAAMAVAAMVARRHRLQKQEYQERLTELAGTFMETNQCLETARQSIQSVISRNSWDMDSDDAVELASTARTLGVQSKLCAAATRNVVREVSSNGSQPQEQGNDDSDNGGDHHGFGFLLDDNMLEYEKIVNPTTDMQKLYDNLNEICGKFPHQGDSVSVELHKSVPKFIVVEDLLLFRSTLNMLSHCMGATTPSFKAGLRMKSSKTAARATSVTTMTPGSNDDKSAGSGELCVQCVQGGTSLVPLETAKELFANKDSLLAPVATMVRTLGGRFGMYHGKFDNVHSQAEPVQTIYWFRIPYELPETHSPSTDSFKKTKLRVHRNRGTAAAASAQSDNQEVTTDPFQAALINAGCGSGSTTWLASQ